MKYKVTISEEAKNSIIESVKFIAHVNKQSAINGYETIFQTIHTLAEFPLRYPIIENLNIRGKQIHKLIISGGRYLALYCVDNEKVFIYKFSDSRKENKLINDLLK